MSGCIRVRRIGDGPRYAIGATYFSKAIVAESKAVPGMRFEKHFIEASERFDNVWTGYADAVAAVVARLRFKGITVFGTECLHEPESWRTSRSPYLFSAKGLREYQVEGVRFCLMRAREGALLADGMRLGKSCQATITARAFKGKTLILCPAHVVGVWGRPPEAVEGPGEIAKWWPDAWKKHPESGARGVVCLETVKPWASSKIIAELERKKVRTPEEQKAYEAAKVEIITRAAVLKDAQVIICHYDIIYAWVDVLLEWGVEFLICDELHVLAGYESRRSNSIKTIRASVPRMIGLTGTPVVSRPGKIHNLLEILAPGRFGYFWDPKMQRDGTYARLYCDPKQKHVGKGEDIKLVWDFDGRSNLDVPNPNYGRLMNGEVVSYPPEQEVLSHQIAPFALTEDETLKKRLSYFMLRRVKKDVDPELPQKERQIVDVHIAAKHTIGVSTKHLGGDGRELRTILDLAADGKLPTVVDLVKGHIDEGEKIICAVYRRAFAETVAEKVGKKVGEDALVLFTHGGLTQRERDTRIHALRTHEGPGALVATIDTISTGIDLSFAQVMVVAELVWEFHELEQLEERLYKFGKETKSFIQYVIARGTGDELILRGVINKLDNAERLGLSAKDAMKEDLSKRKVDWKTNMLAAFEEMNKAKEPSTGLRRRSR